MQISTLNDAEYRQLRYEILCMMEGYELKPYIDSAGLITIGVGFNLNDANVRRFVLDYFGIADVPALESLLKQNYADAYGPGKVYPTRAALEAYLQASFNALMPAAANR